MSQTVSQSVSADDREESWSEPGSRDLESPRSDVPHRWVFPLNAGERVISGFISHFSPLGSIISLLRCCCCCCCFGTSSERVLTKNRGRAAATCGERILSPFFLFHRLLLSCIWIIIIIIIIVLFPGGREEDDKLSPDSRGDLLLKLAGCFGPHNKQSPDL